MNVVIFVISAILVSTSWAESDHAQISKETIENYVREHTSILLSDLSEMKSKLNNHYDNVMTQKESELNALVNNAIYELRNSGLKDECVREAELQMAQARTFSLIKFSSCKNLTDILVKVGDLARDIGDFSATILKEADDIINGLKDCNASFLHPINTVTCLFTYFKNVIEDIWGFTKQIAQLEQKLSAEVKDIAKDINECIHPSQVQTSLLIKGVVQAAHMCSM